ncbi:MAG: hypothetical protein ACE5K4_02420 [Candidatus Hydrothermarchaeota archaeon]
MRVNIASMGSIGIFVIVLLISYFGLNVLIWASVIIATIASIVGYWLLLPLQFKRIENLLRKTEIRLGEAGTLILKTAGTGVHDIEQIETLTGLPRGLIERRSKMLEVLGLVERQNDKIVLSKAGEDYLDLIKSLEVEVWKRKLKSFRRYP